MNKPDMADSEKKLARTGYIHIASTMKQNLPDSQKSANFPYQA